MNCLILFKSITYAQNAAIKLKAANINSYMIRTPVSLSGGGCGYSLRIKCKDLEAAKKILAKTGVSFISAFRINEQGKYCVI
ncbi:MAG: DUF3343 domain-containing protein [Clostridia bacterium]|nr:DUF3343 domain-containing protein [Clostridia bacterium]